MNISTLFQPVGDVALSGIPPRRFPSVCKLTDSDPETGCMEFEIAKGRFSFRLTAPYSEERRQAASDYAKKHGISAGKSKP